MKRIFIWLVLIGALLSFWYFGDTQPRSTNDWTIKDVLRAAEDGRIDKGTIKSVPTGGLQWTEIRLVLLETSAGQKQVYVARGRLTDDNLQRLQETGLFREVPASSLMTEILVTLLPFIIIIGVLYFLLPDLVRRGRMGWR